MSDPFKFALITNVALLALIGFICWMMKSLWPMVLMVGFQTNSSDEDKGK